jgi:hypothetical protein
MLNDAAIAKVVIRIRITVNTAMRLAIRYRQEWSRRVAQPLRGKQTDRPLPIGTGAWAAAVRIAISVIRPVDDEILRINACRKFNGHRRGIRLPGVLVIA